MKIVHRQFGRLANEVSLKRMGETATPNKIQRLKCSVKKHIQTLISDIPSNL